MISCEEETCSSGSSYVWEQHIVCDPHNFNTEPNGAISARPGQLTTDQYYVQRFIPKSEEQIRLRYFQKLQRSGLLPQKPRKKLHHLIVFDWDDTLFCTSFMSNILQGEWNKVSGWQKQKVEEIDKAVAQTLRCSVNLAEVYIVTNSIEGWVDFCTQTFMPLTHQVIREERIAVVSARETYERKFPNDPQKWKTEAFSNLLNHLDHETLVNVVTIGDSTYEMEAAEQSTRRFQRRFLKTVKLRQKPRGEQLLKQVRLVSSRLSEVFSHPKSMSIKLQPKQ